MKVEEREKKIEETVEKIRRFFLLFTYDKWYIIISCISVNIYLNNFKP
jgi:hypothetical protein